MNFGDAVRRLGLPAAQVANAFGVQPQSLRQMMLEPGKTSARTPPAGWEQVLVQLARSRIRDLEGLGCALDTSAPEPAPGTLQSAVPDMDRGPGLIVRCEAS